MMDISWSYLATLSVLVLSLAGLRVEDHQPAGVMCHQGGLGGQQHHQHLLQHHSHYLLRPVPSDTLPLVELREDPDPVLDPRPDKDLNETELRAALGAHFDPAYVSVSPPPTPEREQSAAAAAGVSDTTQDSSSELNLNNKQLQPFGLMPREIKAMDFEMAQHQQHQKKAHNNKPIINNKKLRRRLQLWLWSYAHCPVAHAWSDLGARFWPRYVRAGSCGHAGHNSKQPRSCSVPEGMLCRPAKTHHVTVLRWRCVAHKSNNSNNKGGGGGGGGGGALRCAWIPVQYPVISECKCSCPN